MIFLQTNFSDLLDLLGKDLGLTLRTRRLKFRTGSLNYGFGLKIKTWKIMDPELKIKDLGLKLRSRSLKLRIWV